MVVVVVRLARPFGVELCPNYVLSDAALALPATDRTYGTAREIAQMVPVSGHATYREFLEHNAWYRAFQPNHAPPRQEGPEDGRSGPRRFAEAVGRSRPIDRLERHHRLHRAVEGSGHIRLTDVFARGPRPMICAISEVEVGQVGDDHAWKLAIRAPPPPPRALTRTGDPFR